MSRKAYSQEERDAIRARMLERAVTAFGKNGIRDTSLEDVYMAEGISKTFFYSFFPSKSALVIEVFRQQSGEMLEVLRSNVWRYGAENGLRETLGDVVAGRWFIASPDDQVYMRSVLSEEEFSGLRNDRIVLFAQILDLIGVPVSRLDPRVFYNLLMPVVWSARCGPGSMPLMYREVSRRSTDIQIDGLVSFLRSLAVDAPAHRT